MPTIDAASRHHLTEAQWAVLEPLLPTAECPRRRGRPRHWPLRGLIDGVPGPGRLPVAGRAGPVRAVVAGVRVVRLLAASGHRERIEHVLVQAADAGGKLG